ncbi:hypothetical protein COL26b_011993 [Colletotrichum chrysophilum]|uniref:uncharacterized protein n=1 Tax=Colletotrichum chrysophilum TaxID=1836956 RepID=UPI00230086B6|nr:uncharacterized protein COL26b_011993 [Colletotrichum chrysophilum]KAJ0340079.1 hypothetical protein KNSL1_011736 [Colletotrichum chrysophilum]KAJ0365596.1 hypothetical protein COL26b_011993 [Colletotrichum chrysophilum]
MAQSTEPRRRFAPVPIETTFESVRKSSQQQQGQQQQQYQPGPAPEPTPEHTPRTPSPNPFEQQLRQPPPQHHDDQQKPKRRFAPQLIETSRRARRVGDTGPATRPTDKTDITPYTNHIYLQRTKSRKKIADGTSSPASQIIQRQPKGARRESEDENAGTYMLEWAAMEAERQMQEAALAAFPNSRPREGGAAHFYFRESSGDDSTPESISPQPTGTASKTRARHANAPRRKSSDLGYWHKHMQEHAEKLAVERGEHVPVFDEEDEDDSAIDRMELDSPPDPLWLTNTRNQTADAGSKGPIGEVLMPLITSDPVSAKDTAQPALPPPEPVTKPIGETGMPYVPSTPATQPAAVPIAKPAQVVPETGFRNAGGGGFGRPFGNFGLPAETSEFRRMRKAASPPMLGKDIVFRKCPSPKQTKLEPDHPFSELPTAEERNRDTTGEAGLWRGYCFRKSESDQAIVPASLQGPRMLHTPLPPSTPGDPFAAAFGKSSLTDEPGSHYASATLTPSTAEHRVRSGDFKGLHMLHGLEERLKREKALEEKIASEFDDTFITQVYNYLSLGYPAMARSFDEELAKISHMSVDELEMEDAKQMASGHLMEPAEAEMAEEKRCPRWKALKAYIFEWARQHPDLDSLDPLAWGVRERRGSWAI